MRAGDLPDWRAMTPDDLPIVARIAEVVHPAYPESPAVAAERLRLFPAGCLLATDGRGTTLGYALSHPGRLGRPPALDSLLGGLPAEPDCLYMHDVALLPAARGLGLGAAIVGRLGALAASLGLPHLALIAVNGSAPYWGRFGFAERDGGPALAAKLASYGAGAAYLVAVSGR